MRGRDLGVAALGGEPLRRGDGLLGLDREPVWLHRRSGRPPGAARSRSAGGSPAALDRDLDGSPRRGAERLAGLVGAVGDDLGAERAALHARSPPASASRPRRLGGASAAARRAAARAGSSISSTVSTPARLRPSSVMLLDPAQPLDVLVRVEAGVLRRALRGDQPPGLVHPQRLRMHLGELRGDRDHEHAALLVERCRSCLRPFGVACGAALMSPTVGHDSPTDSDPRAARLAQQALARIVVVERLGEARRARRFCSRVRSRGTSISSR